jgi:2-isopropylmalate synthase
VVSDQSGRSNILARFREIGLEIDPKHPKLPRLLELVKEREFEGYAYDGAEASFELLARCMLGEVPQFYTLHSFRVLDERCWNARGGLVTVSEATVNVHVGKDHHMAVAEGNGPVNALDNALGKVLLQSYPELGDMRLVDYKVRILTPTDGTGAVTRVMIESADGRNRRWSCIDLSTNIIYASYNALQDSISYKLFRDGAKAA